MRFTIEDRYFIKCLQVSNGYEDCARCFWTMNRQLNIDRTKLFNKKVTMTPLTGTNEVV